MAKPSEEKITRVCDKFVLSRLAYVLSEQEGRAHFLVLGWARGVFKKVFLGKL